MRPAPEPASARVRRRELLAAAAVAALARPATASAQDRDGDILKNLIAREEGAAYAYRGVRLAGAGDAAVQDADHVKALRTHLQALGRGTAPISADDLDPAARRLADTGTAAAALALENGLLRVYRAAVLDLTEPAILQSVATMLACHAQRRALIARAAS